MRFFTPLCAAGILLLTASGAYAQQDSVKIPAIKKSYFKAGVNFLSNNVFLGRTDSVVTPTLSPVLKYSFVNGLYLSGALDIITNRKKNRLDGGNIELGYEYNGESNLDWGASFNKLFFNSASTQIDATISSELNAFIDYDLAGIITTSLNVDYSLGKSTYNGDVFINPSLSHDFEIDGVFGQDDELSVSPTACLSAGSQNFYSGYLIRKGKLGRKATSTAFESYSTALGRFTLLDYEVSAPLLYTSGKFSFSVTPTMAFAKNSLPGSTPSEKLITAAIEKTQPVRASEFFVEAGISFKF